MKANDFYKAIGTLISENQAAENIVTAYEKGLITFSECLKTLTEIEMRDVVRKRYQEGK